MIRILLVLTLIPSLISAQVREEKFETDSSVIRIKYFKNYNSIREFNELKDSEKTYFKDLYLDTKNLRTKGVFVDGYCIGKWEYLSNDGKIEETLDYDNGVWTVNNKKMFPFYDYQQKIKSKGDSLIMENYGQDFFDKYVVWNIDGSAIYNNTESGDWNDKFKNAPTEFLLRYDIKLNDFEHYERMIVFSLDSVGELFFPHGLYDNIKGFEHVDSARNIILTKNEAILLSKKYGLAETDSTKASGFLMWKYDDDKKVQKFNGRFIFKVIIKTETIKNLKPNERSSIIDKYDTYNFNPWTKKFIGMEKMKTIYEFEELSGFKTGLMPDE